MMSDSWPTCSATVKIFDHDLSCVLPAHHEYDSQPEHQDPKGTRWSFMVEMRDDGAELDVLRKHS